MHRTPCGLFVFAAASLLVFALPVYGQNSRQIVPPPGVTTIVALQQNWTDAEAVEFYEKAQGSRLIPYRWFLALEQKGNTGRFLDAEFIRQLGYLPRSSSSSNPDGLPVGFTRDDAHLGFTCAACHTQLIVHESKGFLIDGGPTLGDLEGLLRAIVDSLDETLADGAKFTRFADKVLSPAASATERNELKAEVQRVRDFRNDYNQRNLSRETDAHPRFGPSRVDAIGSIFNEVSSVGAKLPDNHLPNNAPVSYPFLWDTPQHDRVQWNGSVENTESILAIPLFGTKYIGALGRNAGEVLGVFGEFEVTADGLLPNGYSSTVKLRNLMDLEALVRKLWSPQWPANSFGAINSALKEQGKVLFAKHCVECHRPIDRTSDERFVEAWLDHSVGTDENMAKNFLSRTVKTGAFKDQYVQVPGLARFRDQAKQAELLVHSVKRVLIGGGNRATPVPFNVAASAEVFVDGRLDGRKLTARFESLDLIDNQFQRGKFDPATSLKNMVLRVEQKAFKAANLTAQENQFQATDGNVTSLKGFSTERLDGAVQGQLRLESPVPVQYIYKGRPLNGIWATAPYLHNGSVPNLDELLKAPAARVKKFSVGSRKFDTDKVGFVSELGDSDYTFDTSLPGNGNGGHEYGDKVFTPDERKALIEYMKSL